MNAPLYAEVLSRSADPVQADLPLASEGVLRYVWESRFGPVLIEARDGKAYVNGELVEPAASPARAATGP